VLKIAKSVSFFVAFLAALSPRELHLRKKVSLLDVVALVGKVISFTMML
jgi:hypothetical protein